MALTAPFLNWVRYLLTPAELPAVPIFLPCCLRLPLTPRKHSSSLVSVTNMAAPLLTVLHQYFLSLFGLNIGELWDLKALAQKCKELGRYSFLLTSVPLNVPGGVGSPPNALAVF